MDKDTIYGVETVQQPEPETAQKYNPIRNLDGWRARTSDEERHLQAVQAAKIGGQRRRERKNTADVLKMILEMDISTVKLDAIQGKFDALPHSLTVLEAINLIQAVKALDGDNQSAVYVRDSVGDKPADKVDVDSDISICVVTDTEQR